MNETDFDQVENAVRNGGAHAGFDLLAARFRE